MVVMAPGAAREILTDPRSGAIELAVSIAPERVIDEPACNDGATGLSERVTGAGVTKMSNGVVWLTALLESPG